MKSFFLFISLLGLSTFSFGCSSTNSPSKYTQAQLNAIETRVVDATFDETYSAASSALFDAGYTIAMSDRDGGLLSGEQGKDNTMARIMVSSFIQDTKFRVSIQVLPAGPRTTDVRIKTSINGEPTVNKKAVDKIWTLMQRQVLMREPPSLEAQPTTHKSVDSSSQPQQVSRKKSDDVDTGSYSSDTQSWILSKDN